MMATKLGEGMDAKGVLLIKHESWLRRTVHRIENFVKWCGLESKRDPFRHLAGKDRDVGASWDRREKDLCDMQYCVFNVAPIFLME